MKRDRFQREVIDRCSRFGDWARWVTGERVSEAPYELLREWRRVFGVLDGVPYQRTRIVPQPRACAKQIGFHLEDADHVLLFARVDIESELPVVHMYGPDGVLVVYNDWRDQRAWPWSDRVARGVDFSALPPDVWLHLGRVVRAHLSPYDLVKLANTPLSKGWLAMWQHERMRGLWRDMALPMAPTMAPNALCKLFYRLLHSTADENKHTSMSKLVRHICAKAFPDVPFPPATTYRKDITYNTVYISCEPDPNRSVRAHQGAGKCWTFSIYSAFGGGGNSLSLLGLRDLFNFLAK